MGKFSEKLAGQLIPEEWKGGVIDYQGLKKRLKKMKLSRPKSPSAGSEKHLRFGFFLRSLAARRSYHPIQGDEENLYETQLVQSREDEEGDEENMYETELVQSSDDEEDEENLYETELEEDEENLYETELVQSKEDEDEVVRLTDEMDSIFKKHFSNNDRKKAMMFLRPQQPKDSQMISFFLGLFTGIAIWVLLFVIFLFTTEAGAGYMETVLPGFR